MRQILLDSIAAIKLFETLSNPLDESNNFDDMALNM